jgi:DNA repair ATPase RecN
VWADALARQPLETYGGADAIAEALMQVEATIEQLAELADSTRNDPVKLGAIRARLDAMEQRIRLLRLAGFMPASWRDAMVETDMHRLAERIRATLERHDPSPEFIDDLLEALGQPAGLLNSRVRRGD